MTRQRTSHVRSVLSSGILAIIGLIGLAALTIHLPFADPPKPLTEIDVAVVGYDYVLYFRYPGDDGVLETADDRYGTRNLYAPSGTKVRLRMSSKDFVYTIEVPEIELYEVAVPDMNFEANFVAPRIGSHELLGSQMCGYDHPDLIGKFISQSVSDFRQTMEQLSTSPLLAH